MEQEKIISSYSGSRSLAYASLMKSVYLWMTLALAVTGLTAAYVAGNLPLITQIATSKMLFFGIIIAELALVWILSSRIMTLSFATAGLMFAAYSILNGLTMSILFLVYTSSSIAQTFFITAGTFGVMSLIGYTTKKDLTSFRNLFMMALVGLIIASVVNLFWANSVLYWVISYVGVLLFVGLTAYDTQKIKNMVREYGDDVNEQTQKLALLGSLTLYLDFINLFIYLLRILGDRK
jgi:FtsH-binding integral membrane protein